MRVRIRLASMSATVLVRTLMNVPTLTPTPLPMGEGLESPPWRQELTALAR